jgi:hypothetical protein
MRLLALLFAAILLASPAMAQEPSASIGDKMQGALSRAQDLESDKTLDRMRAVLGNEKPLVLALPEPQADFKIEIKAIHPFHEIFDTPPWQLPPLGWRAPLVGFNLITVFQSMAKAVADAQYARDERAARAEVQRAIADYCAAQPDARGADKICGRATR